MKPGNLALVEAGELLELSYRQGEADLGAIDGEWLRRCGMATAAELSTEPAGHRLHLPIQVPMVACVPAEELGHLQVKCLVGLVSPAPPPVPSKGSPGRSFAGLSGGFGARQGAGFRAPISGAAH